MMPRIALCNSSPFVDKLLDFKAPQHDTLAGFAQTGGGSLCLFAIEAQMSGNEFGDGSPVARYDYFGTVFDLVEELA